MVRQSMSEEDLKWQRRSDARTLAEAEKIKADKERYQGAILGAKEIAQEEVERVKSIVKIAGMKTPKSPKADDGVSRNQSNGRRSYQNPATIGRL